MTTPPHRNRMKLRWVSLAARRAIARKLAMQFRQELRFLNVEEAMPAWRRTWAAGCPSLGRADPSLERVVPVAEDAGRAPAVGCLVPEDHEFRGAEACIGFDVAEILLAFLDGTETLDGIDLQAAH